MKRYLARLAIGTMIYALILLAGAALGVRPSFAESVLVSMAMSISLGIMEALR